MWIILVFVCFKFEYARKLRTFLQTYFSSNLKITLLFSRVNKTPQETRRKWRSLKSQTRSEQSGTTIVPPLFNKKLLPNTGTVTAWYYIVNWWQLRPGHNSKTTSVPLNFLFTRLGTSTALKTPFECPLLQSLQTRKPYTWWPLGVVSVWLYLCSIFA